MINYLYVNNFRCLVNFRAEFDSFMILCGHNGAGKSSVFDAITLILDLASGNAVLGGDGEQDIPHLEFTNWLTSRVQEFELGVDFAGHTFVYTVHIEQKADFEKPRIVHEQAVCDGRRLFRRDLEGVSFERPDGTSAGFPLDWRQAALASIQPRGPLSELASLQEAMTRILVLRPNPRSMERESRAEVRHPDLAMRGLTSWYRSLQQDLDWAIAFRDLLQSVWPDFQSPRLVDMGLNAKALQLRFDGSDRPLFFDQLSDGEKALIALYMVIAALQTGAARSVLIDEPDNYVGLQELQPWVFSLMELLTPQKQALLITHHPEVLNSAGGGSGRILWRDNHMSPTRIGPLSVPDGMSAGEAIARGWVQQNG